MKLRIVFLFFSFLSFGLYAQFDENTKLRTLYEKALYAECIEKSNEVLERDREELYPYFWQLKSYLAIHFSKFHEKQKTALDKALNLAVKIHKKDKNSFFKNTYPEVFEQLEIACLKAAEFNCAEQFEKSDKIYQKLIEIDYKPSVLFARFKCWEFNNQPESILLLEKLVDLNYTGIKEGLKISIENEKYHIELLNRYFFQGLTWKLKLLLKKTKEVYPNSELTYAALLQGCENVSFQYNFDTDLNSLFKYRNDLNSIDSIYPLFVNHNSHYIANYLIANKYLNLSENDQSIDAYKSIKEYLNTFQADVRLDSNKRFFLSYLQRNKSRQSLNYKKVFTYWTDLSKFYQKLSYIEAIKYNENYLQKQNELHLATLYLNYCFKVFPQEKLALTQIKKTLDALLIVNLKNGDTQKDIAKIIELSDNPQVKSLILEEDLKLMEIMLSRKQYSLLSRFINRDLLLLPQHPKLLSMKKKLIINDYKTQMERYNNIDENLYFLKLPDASKCIPGVLSDLGNLAVLTQLNYVRRLAGIYDSCIISPEFASACQQAALMMDANHRLDHEPSSNWTCYKHEGAAAAGNSNLSLGHGFNYALMGQVTDDGSNNWACGHRRWILNPYNSTFGLGSTLNAMCLKVFYTENSEREKYVSSFSDSQFVAWPSADYFPLEIVPNRWSFSLDGADFKNAKVSVTCNGVQLNVKLEKEAHGYALSTLVWTLGSSPVKDQVYVVKISNVLNFNDVKKTYTYKVVFLDIK
jgi:hypothetical protein